MGSPGYTIFCSSGHIVRMIPHHYIDNTKVGKCEYCGSERMAVVLEWGDLEYDNPPTVPHQPLRDEWCEVSNDNIIGKVRVPIYDVSGIERWSSDL